MDILDKTLQKFTKQQAPHALRAKILDIPHTHALQQGRGFWNTFIRSTVVKFAVPALVLALLLGGYYYQYVRIPKIAAAFELRPETSDAAGVPANSAFILKSSKGITASQLRRVITFDPAVEFDVENIGTNTFRIHPKGDLKGDTVYKIQIPQGVGDRNYSWAYQIKANFNVIETTPGNKGTYVPPSSVIEIQFNREGFKNIEQFISVSPRIDAKYEVHGNKVVLIPQKELREGTVYTVTVAHGLAIEGSDDTLAKDYTFSFETAKNVGLQGSFSLQQDFFQQLPNKRPTVGVFYYNIDPAKDITAAQVYRFTSANDFLDSYIGSRNWDYFWTTFYRTDGITPNISKAQKISSFAPQLQEVEGQNFFELPDSLPNGFYFIDVTSSFGHAYAWIQVSPLADYVSITHDTSLVWVQDFAKKEPVANATLSLMQNGKGSSLGKTDQSGLVQFNTPGTLQAESTDNAPVFFGVDGGDGRSLVVAAQDRWGGSKAYKGDVYWKYLTTDRTIYQMADTVNFWGVVKGRSEDLRQKNITVGLYNGYFYAGDRIPDTAHPLISQDVLVSNFNTFEGKVHIKGLQPGTYSLIATNGSEVITNSSVTVATYNKPLYQLTVTSSKDAIFADDEVTFTVKGAFFDGTPIPGLKLNYNTSWNGGSNSDQVTLDQKGQAVVKIKPSYLEGPTIYYPQPLSISFVPAQSEEGEIAGFGSVTVFGPHMYLQAFQEKQEGTNYSFVAKLNAISVDTTTSAQENNFRTDYIGDPVKNYNLKADITRYYYEAVETGKSYDPINKTTFTTYRYDEHKEPVATLSGSTDGKGEWHTTQNLPKVKNGYYVVHVYGTDQAGRKLETTFYAYEIGSYVNYAAYYNPTKPYTIELRIPNTKDSDQYSKNYSVGDTVNLSVAAVDDSLQNNTRILYYRYQNNIMRAVVSDSNSFSETFTKDFIPNVQYRAVVLGPYGMVESNTVFANINTDDKKLHVEIKPDKENYRPGDTATVEVVTKDKNGKSVSAQVNVAVVDEAIFHVQNYSYQPAVLDTLYQTIYTQPLVSYTNFLIQPNNGGGAEKGGCFLAGTQIRMADGTTKGIEDIRVGDAIVTRQADNNGHIVTAVVQGTSSHTVNTYLVINGSLKITPEHVVFSNGEWKPIGNVRVGDYMIGDDGKQVKINSIERHVQLGTTVYNIVVNKYHTYFANGLYVHNAEKGGAERSNFKDTASFQTITTSGGSGSMTFTVPDNITSWRVTARGFSADDMLAGEAQKLLPSGLPLFVDATLSKMYLVGDSPVLKVRTFGTSLQAGDDVVYSITSDTLHLNVKKNVRGGDILEVPLGAVPVGTHDVHISADQGKLHDALLRTITVVPSYFKKAQTSTKNVTNGALGIAGNTEGLTTLVFADSSTGTLYSALKNITYSNGVRSDGVTATHVAQQLLHQYFAEPEAESIDLGPYQRDTNGISLFTYSDPDLELSAKISDLSPEQIRSEDLAKYFNGTMTDENADASRIALSLYGLAGLQKPVLAKLQSIEQSPDFSTTDKVYIALGLAKFGDAEGARSMYLRDIKPKLSVNGIETSANFTKDASENIKLTASVAELAAVVEERQDIPGLLEYLTHHQPDRDLNVAEYALAIRAVLQHAAPQDASFSISVDGKSEKVHIKNGETYTRTLTTDSLKAATVANVSGSVSVTSFYEVAANPQTLKKQSTLQLTRSYSVNGKETRTFTDGDIVKVTLTPTIGTGSLSGEYQVVDFLPSGLKPITDPFSVDKGYYYQCNAVWYPTTIENNTLYFSIYSGGYVDPNCPKSTINYYARVISKGQFVGNPALLQSTRDAQYLTITDKSSVTIK